MEQDAHRKPSGNLIQPTDMRQTLSRPRAAEARRTAGKQEPDGSPFHSASYISWCIADMQRPLTHKLSAFTPPISGSDISQGIWNLDNLLFKCIIKIECC